MHRQVAGEVAVGKSTVCLRSSVMPIAATPTSNWPLATAGSTAGEVLAGEDHVVLPAAARHVLEQLDVEAREVTLRVSERVGLEVPDARDPMVPASISP